MHKRYELAKSLRQNIKSSSEKSLLETLLDQSDQYTGFMLARSRAPQQNGGSTMDYAKVKSTASSNKQSKSPRRQQRRRDYEEEILMKEADEELTGHQQGFWTRLSQQPAIITGGTLKPYQLEV